MRLALLLERLLAFPGVFRGAFDAGATIPDMARKHARTQGSIRLRLEKLGKLPPSGEARFENPPIAA